MAKRYYKSYKAGGRTVPGMFKAVNGNGEGERPNMPEEPLVEQPALPTVTNQSDSLAVANSLNTRNNMVNMQMQNAVLQNQQMQALLQQMKLQNDSLQTQNQLLNTQVEKMNLINSARTTKKSVGSSSTPKRRGGTVKRKGGSCLPGGRYSKKRR